MQSERRAFPAILSLRNGCACVSGLGRNGLPRSGGDWFSAEKLKQSVEKRAGQRLSKICDGIVSDVREFCGEDIFDDDVRLVGAEMR